MRRCKKDWSEDWGFLLGPVDTEDEGSRLPPVDTEDEGSRLPPVDTEDEGSRLPPVDTEDEGSRLPPVDTEDEGSRLPPVDTDEWRFEGGARRRRKTRRRGSHDTDALCGDYPSGRPGNIRRSVKAQISGNIIVRLAAHLALAPGATLEDLAQQADLKGLLSILGKYELNDKSRRMVARRGSHEASEDSPDYGAQKGAVPGVPFDPQDVSPREIFDIEETVANSPLAPLHSLATYWRLDANHKPGKLKKILKRLNRLGEVSLAYPELRATDPSDGMEDPFVGAQTFLDRAPYGIDVRWARRWGGDGSGIALVDMEQGWMPDHSELAAPPKPILIHGNNRDGDDGYRGNHGTAVLGEIVAASNKAGVEGIAPKVVKVGLASHFHSEPENGTTTTIVPKTDSHVAEAIYAAVTAPKGEEPFLKKGDVLLIEAQRAYLPTEIDPADFDAIRLASALGVIVVEAAGNGGRNLDKYRDSRGTIFNRRRGSHQESGAIMVGAALGALPHNRKRASNYGSRIDCYAWGNRVVTSGYGDLAGTSVALGGSPNSTYTANFTNTSAAAPIIAGAALILQGMYRSATQTMKVPDGRRLSPGQMRALLADPANGTRQGRGVRGHIGVMPNLRAIAENTLRIVPDVYSRDNLGDTGAVPMRRISACPDVLVSQKRWSDPAKTYGEGTGQENVLALGYKAVIGEENFIYVRMKNRGRCDAKDVTATVYWSETATLVTPNNWHEIGCCEPITVPQGDTLTVAGPIEWDIPRSGRGPKRYCCLVALIEGGGEPTRLPPGLLASEGATARQRRRGKESEPPAFDWHAFLRFLRDHNHIGVRNLHVVDNIPGPDKEKKLDFLITGTPEGDRGRFFDLEVLQTLPKGAELCLEVPASLAPAMSMSAIWEPEVAGDYLRFCLPALPQVPLCRVPLAAGARHGCRFIIRGGKALGEAHGFAIRQLYRGQEVGRVSWQFHRLRRRA